MKARREKAKVKFQNISATTIAEVKQRLEQHHSPEQLASRMKLEGVGKISYETIYLMIYANHQEMGIYQQYLGKNRSIGGERVVIRSAEEFPIGLGLSIVRRLRI